MDLKAAYVHYQENFWNHQLYNNLYIMVLHIWMVYTVLNQAAAEKKSVQVQHKNQYTKNEWTGLGKTDMSEKK